MSTTTHAITTPNYLEETSTHGAYMLTTTVEPVPTRGYKTNPNQITYQVVLGIQDKTHATRNLASFEVSVDLPQKTPEKLHNVSRLLAEQVSELLTQGDNKVCAENVAISAEQISISYTRHGALDDQVNESTKNKKHNKKKLGDALTESLQRYADMLSQEWGNITPAPASFVTSKNSVPTHTTPAWAVPTESAGDSYSNSAEHIPANQFEERDFTGSSEAPAHRVHEEHPEEGAMKIGFWGRVLRFFGVA